MPRSGFIQEDPKKHYWGIKHGRIDVTKDENGNWSDTGEVSFTTFDASRVPVLLLRYVPYCPECLETCMTGFINWENDLAGQGGYAYRCFHHFWYNGEQIWSYPPRERIGEAAYVPTAPVIDGDDPAYVRGRTDFAAGIHEWSDPFDGRTAEGKAWYRGWRAANMEGLDGISCSE